MSLEGIQKKILAEGEKERAGVMKQFAQEKVKIERKAEQDIQIMRDRIGQETLRRKAEILERARIDANLEARNKVLERKRELLGQVFEAVQKHFRALEGAPREKFLAAWLAKAVEEFGTENVRLVATKRDQEGLRRLVKKYHGLKLRKETLKADGGFMITNVAMEQSYTIQGFIEENREKWEHEVAKILFV